MKKIWHMRMWTSHLCFLITLSPPFADFGKPWVWSAVIAFINLYCVSSPDAWVSNWSDNREVLLLYSEEQKQTNRKNQTEQRIPCPFLQRCPCNAHIKWASKPPQSKCKKCDLHCSQRKELQTRCASHPLAKPHPTAEALTLVSHWCTSQPLAPREQSSALPA